MGTRISIASETITTATAAIAPCTEPSWTALVEPTVWPAEPSPSPVTTFEIFLV